MMKRLLPLLLLALSLGAISAPIIVHGPTVFPGAGGGPTTLATDTFNRADGAIGANWTGLDVGITFNVTSNEAKPSGTADLATTRYTGVAFPNDQWAQVSIGTIVEATSDNGAGPIVRGQAGGNIYFLQGNAVETRVYKRVSGGYTKLGSDGPSIATGDVLKLQAVGTTITATKNGVSICGSPITDSDIASGNAGMWDAASTAQATLDSFSAGSP